jgi:hypothetical protein
MVSSPASKHTNLSADESAALLAGKLRRQEPFFFLRYGDGAIECIAGRDGMTCDRETYSPELGANLLAAWRAVIGAPDVYIGDWLSASFETSNEASRYAEQYAELIGDAKPNFLHFEALLLMRESAELVDFYRAVKQDRRVKVFMGPQECAGAAKMMGARHLVTPMRDLNVWIPSITERLFSRPFDVLLYGAGMAGNVAAVNVWRLHPERTYINLGSAMDPLFRGRTRRQQISPQQARQLFRELL